MIAIGRELELLYLCVRHPQDAVSTAAIRQQVGQGVDWDRVLLLMARHRVTGLASRTLLEANLALPDKVLRHLRSERGRGAMMELRAASEAVRLVAEMSAKGIRPILLKGPGVSLQAFGTLGVRTNRDIDLLVSRDEVATASLVLEGDGYQRVEPRPQSSAEEVERWLVARKDMVYRRADGHCVEVHWRLFDNPVLMAGFDPEVRTIVEAGGLRFEVLGGATNLIYLCAHGAQHAWSRLKWLADVAALFVRLDGSQLESLLADARVLGVEPSVAQAMLLAARRMGLVLPHRLERRLRRSLRTRFLVFVAELCLAAGNGRELEDQRWVRALKNVSHYLIATGHRYRQAEFRFDLLDLDAAGLPPSYRRFGPFARLVAHWKRPLLEGTST